MHDGVPSCNFRKEAQEDARDILHQLQGCSWPVDAVGPFLSVILSTTFLLLALSASFLVLVSEIKSNSYFF